LGIGLVFAVAGAIVVLLVNRDRVIVAPLKPALPDGVIARPLEHQIAALAAGVAVFTQ
jgi:hypothetical protein